MHKNDLMRENPLKRMGFESDDIIPEGGFGAVLARAGVGKTSFLVQIALNAMLRDQNVLHISLDDPVNKICLWYKEVFNNIAQKYSITDANELWDTVLPHRFIMTFKVDRFNIPRLSERLNDLMAQNIFSPNVILIDGVPFDQETRGMLTESKALAKKYGFRVWFTVRTHRHEAQGADGIPAHIESVTDLFDAAIQLKPKGKEINVKALKGAGASDQPGLLIDPSTMLIKEQ